MQTRALLIAAVVLLALSFLVWQLENSSNSNEADSSSELLFPQLDLSSVRRLSLQTESGTVVLYRDPLKPGDWLTKGPPVRAADDARAESILRAATQLRSHRSLSPNGKLSDFGLAQTARRI